VTKPKRRPPVPAPPPVTARAELSRLPLGTIRERADNGDLRCQLFLTVVGASAPCRGYGRGEGRRHG
jgi:hypothetical protein